MSRSGDATARPLLAILGQSAPIAVLLGLAFGRLAGVADPIAWVARTMNLVLLVGVSCFWFGCNTAAEEMATALVPIAVPPPGASGLRGWPRRLTAHAPPRAGQSR